VATLTWQRSVSMLWFAKTMAEHYLRSAGACMAWSFACHGEPVPPGHRVFRNDIFCRHLQTAFPEGAEELSAGLVSLQVSDIETAARNQQNYAVRLSYR
jgi:hypothetical protein